ncbi:MAG TPA: ferredoxin [Acidimicrobiales bacterium]
MRVVIDADACSGNGRCYSLVPELFTDDESGYGQVVDGGEFGEGQRELAEKAVRACPEDAISIEEG